MPRTPSPILEITEEIIANAERRNSSACMIADTIKVAIPEASYVTVDLQTCRFTLLKQGLRFTYLTPSMGQSALVNFDQGDHTKPFTMRLRGGHATKAGRKKKAAGAPRDKTTITTKAGQMTRSGGAPPPLGALSSTSPKSEHDAKKRDKRDKKDHTTGVGSRRRFGIKNLKL